FLMAPLGNDLLVIVLSASHHDRMLYYAGAATAGSVVGCFIVDVLSRKAERGLQKEVPQTKLRFFEKQLQRHAGWAVMLAALLPPPFPFTPFIAAAAVAQYPR